MATSSWRRLKVLASTEKASKDSCGGKKAPEGHLLDLVSPRVHPAAQASGPNHPPEPAQTPHHIRDAIARYAFTAAHVAFDSSGD